MLTDSEFLDGMIMMLTGIVTLLGVAKSGSLLGRRVRRQHEAAAKEREDENARLRAENMRLLGLEQPKAPHPYWDEDAMRARLEGLSGPERDAEKSRQFAAVYGRRNLPLVPAVFADEKRRCKTCENFDLEAGQAMARRHGPFQVASQFISPSEMGAKATPEGEVIERDIPVIARWDQFGLCKLRSEGLWGETDAERRARMAPSSEGEAPFLTDGKDCYEPALRRDR